MAKSLAEKTFLSFWFTRSLVKDWHNRKGRRSNRMV